MHHRLRIIARSQVSSHDELFECAPPTGLLRRLGLIRPGAANARERALMVVVIAWIPLVALSAIDGGVTTLTAAMAAARYLIARAVARDRGERLRAPTDVHRPTLRDRQLRR